MYVHNLRKRMGMIIKNCMQQVYPELWCCVMGAESPRRMPVWPRRWRHCDPSKWWKPHHHIQGDFRLHHHCCEHLRSCLVHLDHSHYHTLEYKGGVIRVFLVGSTIGDRSLAEADRNVLFLLRVSIETCPRARQVCCLESLPSLQDIQWLY